MPKGVYVRKNTPPRLGKTKKNDDGVRRMAESRTGKKHFNWKGGKIRTPYGYIKCWRKGHPKADSKGYVVEHILVMEKKIGRHLTKEEVVHHENEIKDDNRIENLRLFKNTGEHSRYHRLKENDKKHNMACENSC